MTQEQNLSVKIQVLVLVLYVRPTGEAETLGEIAEKKFIKLPVPVLEQFIAPETGFVKT